MGRQNRRLPDERQTGIRLSPTRKPDELCAIQAIVVAQPAHPTLTWLLLASALASSCRTEDASRAASELGGPEPVSESAAHETEGRRAGVPADRMEQALGAQAKKHAKNLLRDDVRFDGELDQGKHGDHLLVLKSIYCYRILGVGGPDVVDLDLALFDPDGVEVQRDLGQDAFPVLGQPVNLCPPEPGAYRLQVGMYEGHGPYVVGVYHTP